MSLQESYSVTRNPLIPASFPLGMAWYVVFVSATEMRHSKDRDAGDDDPGYFPIERRINEASFETYVPVEITKEIRKGKRIKRVVPIFGSYVFVRFDIERDEWGEILSLEGVHKILRQLDIPKRVPDDVIEFIRRCEEGGLFGGEGLKPGDKVSIKKDGPFSHLIGKIKSTTKNKRTKVLLGELGVVDIETCYLEKID